MRKWQTTIVLTAVGIAVGAYLYLAPTPERKTTPIDPPRAAPGSKHDGDAEASEVIEPLRVDGAGNPTAPTTVDQGPLPTVVLEPGQQQPPRPDAEPGTKLRMPYADEQEGISQEASHPGIFDLFESTTKDTKSTKEEK